MEFIGNKISGKEIGIIFLAAFFAGRICLFDGAFPAALAFVIVILAVSTVYIYLVPVICGAVALYGAEGYFIYDDLLAILLVSVFFLFFHKRRFSIHQRTAVGAAIIVLAQLAAHGYWDMLFLLRPEMMVKTLAALYIYVRAFNTLAKVLFVGKPESSVSRERVSVALELLAISYLGTLGSYPIIFSLWLLMICICLYYKGLKEAMTVTGIAVIFSLCQGEVSWQLYAWLFAGVLTAWYGVNLIDRKYRKTMMGAILFLFVSGGEGPLIYAAGTVTAIFVAIPEDFIAFVCCRIEERFMPELSTEKDLQHLAIRKDLQKKRDAFVGLSRLYGNSIEGKQIVSYQFLGMARTIDGLLEDLHGDYTKKKQTVIMPISIGQASYSLESVSGDSMAAFAFGDSKVAMVISDGMGKGKAAAEESNLVVATLSKLLQAGFDVDLAIKTINGILIAGNGEERFATVDLAIIDRKKGRAKIYKMGAATTFIKHDGRVSMLKRQALPAGITSGLDLEYIDIKLKRGDLLVMVSDGVTDCDRKDYNCDWLRSRLLEIGSRDPETVAELVVNKAAEKYGIRERDDLTVMTAAIGV